MNAKSISTCWGTYRLFRCASYLRAKFARYLKFIDPNGPHSDALKDFQLRDLSNSSIQTIVIAQIKMTTRSNESIFMCPDCIHTFVRQLCPACQKRYACVVPGYLIYGCTSLYLSHCDFFYIQCLFTVCKSTAVTCNLPVIGAQCVTRVTRAR